MPAAHPIPEEYPRLVSYLCVDSASAAIAFYGHVLGSRERLRVEGADGKIGHAELALGDSLIMLADEAPGIDFRSPRSVGGTPVMLHAYVDDVDATFGRAIEAGAAVLQPVEDQPYGDRSGQFEDPFGHRWTVASRIQDVPPTDLAHRAAG